VSTPIPNVGTSQLHAKYSFLPMWPGYFIAGAMFAVSFAAHGSDSEKSLDPLVLLLSLSGWIYWLVCIYRLHSIIANITGSAHPIEPGKAVWGHFIPCYNVFWVFIWSNAIARFVRSHAGSRMLGGWFGIPLALSLLVSALMGIADAPGDLLEAGIYASPFLLLQYAVGHYLTHRVRGAIAQPLNP
jgi:hypothetical protein